MCLAYNLHKNRDSHLIDFVNFAHHPLMSFFLNLKFQNHNLKQGEEHWLGLDTMYYLTQERNYSLIVKMEDVNGIIEEVVYDTFIILNKVSSNTSINRW